MCPEPVSAQQRGQRRAALRPPARVFHRRGRGLHGAQVDLVLHDLQAGADVAVDARGEQREHRLVVAQLRDLPQDHLIDILRTPRRPGGSPPPRRRPPARRPRDPRCPPADSYTSARLLAAKACARGTTPGPGFVTSDHWKIAPRGLRSTDNERRHRFDQVRRGRCRGGAAGPAAHRRGHRHAAPGEPGRLRPAPGRGAGGQAAAGRRAGDPAGRRAGPHRRGPLAGAAVPPGPPVRRPGLGGQPAAAPHDAGLPGRRADRRRRGGRGRAGRDRRRTGRVRAHQPGRRAGPEQQPAAEPGRGEGRRRHRRQERPGGPAAFRRRHGGSAAGADHGRAGRVRSRGGPGRHARARWSCGPRCSS